MQELLYPNLEALLAPETLNRFSNQRITSVNCSPLKAGHAVSGSKLYQITTNGGEGPSFVLKRISPEWDWIMRATGDDRGREAVIFRIGFLNALPPELTHAVLACGRDGDGWALLMRDMSAVIFLVEEPWRVGYPITPLQNTAVLRGLATLHATYWEQSEVMDPALGFCAPGPRFHALSRAVAAQESGTPIDFLDVMRTGWEILPTLIDAGIAREITHLADNPEPLIYLHDRFPLTVVHGDPRPPNLGFVPQADGLPQVLLYDWQLAGPGWATTDLAWYLNGASTCDAVTLEPSIAIYRDALAAKLGPRFDESWWPPLLSLGLLGQFVRMAHNMAWRVALGPEAARPWCRRSLTWWSEKAADGLHLLHSLT